MIFFLDPKLSNLRPDCTLKCLLWPLQSSCLYNSYKYLQCILCIQHYSFWSIESRKWNYQSHLLLLLQYLIWFLFCCSWKLPCTMYFLRPSNSYQVVSKNAIYCLKFFTWITKLPRKGTSLYLVPVSFCMFPSKPSRKIGTAKRHLLELSWPM